MQSLGVPLTGGTRPRAVQTSRRGRRIRSTGADVRADMATVSRRTEISMGTAYCGHACPWKGVRAGFTVATPLPVPLDEDMGFVGVAGRLHKDGFS